MAEEEKKFYPFKIKLSDQEERKQKIERLKQKYPFSQLLHLLSLDSGKDESTLEAELRAELHRQQAAMAAADHPDNRKNPSTAYQEYKDKEGKQVQNIEEIFKAYRILGDNEPNEHDYEKYETEKALIKSQVELSESEIQEKVAELNETYKEVIRKHEEFEKAEEIRDDFKEEFDFLEKLSPETCETLLRFYKDCEKEGQMKDFNQVYAEFMLGDGFPSKVHKDRDGKITSIENEHRFALGSKGDTIHSIRNLSGSGLDISWVNGEFGIACLSENMSEAQLKALAEYCFHNGIDISDYKALHDLKVVDKDNKEINTADIELEKEINRLKKTKENTEEKDIDYANTAKDDNELSEMLGGNAINVTAFVGPDKDIKVDRKTMVDKAKARIGLIGKGIDDNLIRTTRGWNSTVISVYASENDRIRDGEIDKNGFRQHTKAFAVEIKHTIPPRGRYYFDQNKEFKPDHARVLLDGFKACGCKYFTAPSGEKMGKQVMGAFMVASVKTGVVPYCKKSKNGKGMILGAADIAAIQKAISEEQWNTDSKIDYQLRLAKELEGQIAYQRQNPKYEDNSYINTEVTKLKMSATFAKFTSSYLESLQEFINGGIDGKYGEKWDEIDRAAALKGLMHIAQDMEKGKLFGARFDPFDKSGKNLDKMKQALTFYMTAEKPKIVADIHKQIRDSGSDVKDSKITSAVRDVTTKIEKDVINGHFGSYMKDQLGIEGLKPQVKGAMVKYVPSKYMKMDDNIDDLDENDNKSNKRIIELYQKGQEKDVEPPLVPKSEKEGETDLRSLAQQTREYLKEQAKIKTQGGKTQNFSEWIKKRRSAYQSYQNR